MKIKFISALMASLMILSTSIFVSCNKEVEGCTDTLAENFNPDATLDNGSCVYARDKFLGTFIGSLTCPVGLPSADEFTMIFTESLNGIDKVEISFQSAEVALPVLEGVIDGNEITIESMQTSIPLDPTNPDLKTELIFSGQGTIDSSGETISGTISVTVVLLSQTITCTFSATKQ